MDDFEKRLERQSLRQIPTDWREEILANARAVKPQARVNLITSIFTSPFREFILSLRWHLAGISTAWLVVLFLNVDYSPSPIAALPREKIPSPRQLLMALMENRRQLLLLTEQPAIEPASLPPRRSQCQSSEAIV